MESFAKLADTIFFQRIKCVVALLMLLGCRACIKSETAWMHASLFAPECSSQCSSHLPTAFGWCSGGGSQRHVLYISRFADATLQWPSDGVAVTMSHDYLSFHDKARVSLHIQTLKHQHWEGTIQVGPCVQKDSNRPRELASAASACLRLPAMWSQVRKPDWVKGASQQRAVNCTVFVGTEELRQQPELQDDGDVVVLDHRYANGEGIAA